MGSLAQAQVGAQAQEDLAHTEAAVKARNARQKGSRRSLQKGGVLYASHAREMVTQKVVDEVAQAQAIVNRAQKAQAKKDRKVFCEAVVAKRREILKVRSTQKKLRKELCKEIRARARKARARGGNTIM
jgi:hypothetical protein